MIDSLASTVFCFYGNGPDDNAVSDCSSFIGPSVYDRILAVNMFGTKTVILIGVLGYLTGRPAFLDIALVYALMNFITTIACCVILTLKKVLNPIHMQNRRGYDGTSCRGFDIASWHIDLSGWSDWLTSSPNFLLGHTEQVSPIHWVQHSVYLVWWSSL